MLVLYTLSAVLLIFGYSFYDLQGNAFTGTVPREIADLTSLQFLTLDNTNLGGEIGTILKNAVNLKTFSARNTSLTGSINGTDWLRYVLLRST